MPSPELSIVIPTLNEAETLPLLLGDLQLQRGVVLEVIIADGGSIDGTCAVANNFLAEAQTAGSCIVVTNGRGRQLNAGASFAKAEWFLFLHADSRIVDSGQLRNALDIMRRQQRQCSSRSLAGRFALRFGPSSQSESFGLYFYEAKAALGRPGCIHGDQGFLMNKRFFLDVGPFREDLPVMEDTLLAEKIRNSGQWLLLPGVIETSSRRFQVEGLKSRQTLNALMMNFLHIGWLDFFTRAPDVYRQQDRTLPLQLRPFFLLIKGLFQEMSLSQKWTIWKETGSYVRSQAWQIGLALDCRQAYRRGVPPGQQSCFWLNSFDRWFDPLTNHWAGHVLTALLVRIWFLLQLRTR